MVYLPLLVLRTVCTVWLKLYLRVQCMHYSSNLAVVSWLVFPPSDPEDLVRFWTQLCTAQRGTSVFGTVFVARIEHT